MKKILLVLLAASLNVSAEEKVNVNTICANVEDGARAIMSARQSGVALKRIIEIATKNDDEYSKELAMKAYAKSKYNLKEYQDKAIEDFANDEYLYCLMAFKKSE